MHAYNTWCLHCCSGAIFEHIYLAFSPLGNFTKPGDVGRLPSLPLLSFLTLPGWFFLMSFRNVDTQNREKCNLYMSREIRYLLEIVRTESRSCSHDYLPRVASFSFSVKVLTIWNNHWSLLKTSSLLLIF